MSPLKNFFTKRKEKNNNSRTIKELKKAVQSFVQISGMDFACEPLLDVLEKLNPNDPVTEDLTNIFKFFIHQHLNREDLTNKYAEYTSFQLECYRFSNYATAIKESDGSYSIIPVISNDAAVDFVIESYLDNPEVDIVEALKHASDMKREDLRKSRINPYYGVVSYIQVRTKAIMDAISMLRNHASLTPADCQLIEIKYAEASEYEAKINSVYEENVTRDSYVNLVHRNFHELIQIENELAFISEKIWQQFFSQTGAKLVHALSSGIVESNQMDKICTTLYMKDLATIPYGHTGYQYDFSMKNVLCICEEDAGSWQISKDRFIGMDSNGIVHGWQFSEDSHFFYEHGYQSKLFLPAYIERKSRENNSGSNYMYYTEILLDNSKDKVVPVKAFYTPKATTKEIEEISALAHKQGIELEFIDTEQVANMMNLQAKVW